MNTIEIDFEETKLSDATSSDSTDVAPAPAPKEGAGLKVMSSASAENIITNDDNILTAKQRANIESLYDRIRPLFADKSVDDLYDFSFWFKLISELVKLVETMKMSGTKKKAVIVEVICEIVKNEVKISDTNKKEKLLSYVRNIAGKIIDVLVGVSRHVNVPGIINSIVRCCCCCCANNNTTKSGNRG